MIDTDITLGGLVADVTDRSIVLNGATVLDGDPSVPAFEGSILIERGIVKAVRHMDPPTDERLAADGVETIDARGKFLMPGLIDLHIHLTGDYRQDLYQRYMDSIPRTRVLRAAEHAARILKSGVTTVRNLGHGDPYHVAALGDAIDRGQLPGPSIVSAGWSISQTGGHGNLRVWPYWLVERMNPRSAFADGERELSDLVRRNIAEGAGCVKFYATEGVIYTPDRLSDIQNFSAGEMESITAAAHDNGVKVAVHTTGVDGTLAALRAGVDTIEHGPHQFDEEFLDVLAESGASLVPTLFVFDGAARRGADSPWPDWVSRRAERHLVTRLEIVRAARARGVPIGMGTDSGGPPRGGQNTRELELLVQAGLTPLEAIGASTSVAARAIGLLDIGRIAPGMRADMLLLDEDPREDIAGLRSSIITIFRSRRAAA